MVVKTYKEFKNKKVEVEKSTPTIVIEDEKEEKEEKLYHLRHPDYPVVSDCIYKLEKGIDLEIKNGVIVTDDEEIKNKLVNNGFHYLGYKIDGKPFI